MSDKEDPIEFRLVLIGDYYVGKTSILNRYIFNDFKSNIFPIGAPFLTKAMVLENINIKFIIYDPYVSSNFYYPTNHHNVKGDAFILVYDISDKKSFDKLKNFWLDVIKRNIQTDAGKIIYL